MIICLSNNKGGVGKTTLAINLASHNANNGHRVLLIDADPLGSVVKWQGLSEKKTFDVIHYPEKTLHKDIDKLSEGYTHTIIDAPPGAGNIIGSSLITSHMAIVPVDPSPLSIWASRKIIFQIKQAQKYNKWLKGRLLISKSVAGTILERRARKILTPYGIALFNTEVHHRIDFVKSFFSGLSVLQYAPRSKAADEIRCLCQEIDFDAYDSAALLQDKKQILADFKKKVADKRRNHRKERIIPTDFAVQGRVYGGYIQNISTSGAFIETRESFSSGQEITLTFHSPKRQRHVKISGEIFRTEPTGIGIKFKKNIKIR